MHILSAKSLKQKFVVGAFLLFLLALVARFIRQLVMHYGLGSWGVSEFLINYQGGFVRRGLMGELLFSFAKFSDINIEVVVKVICCIFYFLLCYFFVRSFLRKGYPLYILPLCFFLGAFIFSDAWIRKDTMMLCFFIAIVWLYNHRNLSVIIKIVLINTLSVFMILTHEVFVFFSLPILFVLFIYLFKQRHIGISLCLSFLSLLPSVVAFLLAVLKHGDQDTAQIIWNSWQSLYNIDQTNVPFWNSIGAIGWTSLFAAKYHITCNFLQIDNGLWSLFIWLITFPLVYYIATNALVVFKKTASSFTEKDKTNLSIILLFQLFFLIPVFGLLSCDYVRIISYWICSSFTIFLLTPQNIIEKIVPYMIISKIEKLNKYMCNILTPTKEIIFLMILLIGIAEWTFTMEQLYHSSMLYQILWLLSKPFVIFKGIYLQDFTL